MQVDCGEPPLQLRRIQLQLKYALKIKKERNHINSHLLADHWTYHYGKYKLGEEPWFMKIKTKLDLLDSKFEE